MKTRYSKLRMRLLPILMVIMMMFSICSVAAYAANDVSFRLSSQSDITAFKTLVDGTENSTSPLKNKEYTYKATSVTSDGGISAKVKDLLTCADDGKCTFMYTVFEKLETKSQQAFITDLMGELKTNQYSATATQEISDALSSADSSVANLLIPFVFDDLGADMATAYKWVAPLLNTLRIILGVLAIGVLVILLLSTVLDCAYIGLPVFREVTSKGKDGNSNSPDKKPFGVSYDAYKTILDTENAMNDKDGTYKNPFGVYFKRRAVTYIILALCLFYLVAGEMSGLISWLLSLVSGITG